MPRNKEAESIALRWRELQEADESAHKTAIEDFKAQINSLVEQNAALEVRIKNLKVQHSLQQPTDTKETERIKDLKKELENARQTVASTNQAKTEALRREDEAISQVNQLKSSLEEAGKTITRLQQEKKSMSSVQGTPPYIVRPLSLV